MKRIEDYIEKVCKEFHNNSEEVKILKEEVRAHLYDKVRDLIEEGYNEEESINIALKDFGDESGFVYDMKRIISKQKIYTNILLKISFIIFIIGGALKFGGMYAESIYIDKWEKSRPMTYIDVIDKIEESVGDKTEITKDDKKNFDDMLNKYNDQYNNGLYYIKVFKNDKSIYEYERIVDNSIVKNKSQGESGKSNGLKIVNKKSDIESLRTSDIWNERANIANISNTIHFKLRNIGLWMIILSWVLMIMYYTQKSILNEKLDKKTIILLSIETIIIFAIFTSDKDIIVTTVGILMLLNFLISNVKIKGKTESIY